MNILFISSTKRWGGVVSWMLKSAGGLQKKGHKITILSHPHPRSKLYKHNIPNVTIVTKKLESTLLIPLTVLSIVRFIKKNKIDIIVTNIGIEVSIGGIAAKISGIPHIRRIGGDFDFTNSLKKKIIQKMLVNYCLVPCYYIIDASIKKFPWLSKEKFTVIYNGRNPYNANPNEIRNQKIKWDIKSNEKIIGMTCQLIKRKHTEDLITVFTRIHYDHPDWKIVIAGEGPELSKLKKLVNDLSLDDKVIFAGFTHDPVFTASCYDIAMSTSENEGFPNTIVEYFSVGKPVISTDVGGVSEIIKDRKNGILVNFGNLRELETAILELIKNEELRNILGASGLITLKEKFTEDVMINNLEKFFLDKVNIRAHRMRI